MLKKLLLILYLVFFIQPCAFTKEIPVKVETLLKISTSNVNLHEGDNLSLAVAEDVFLNSKLYIKKDASVDGVITSLIDNGFTCQEASIYAENFRVKTILGDVVKLKGIVYVKGRNHWMLTQFLPLIYILIRGGEAQMLPSQDIFTLYLEANNEDL